MKYYVLDITEPTNSGSWVTTKVYADRDTAMSEAKRIAEECDDEEEFFNEWDDAGPNWSYIFKSASVSVKEIDNDYAI